MKITATDDGSSPGEKSAEKNITITIVANQSPEFSAITYGGGAEVDSMVPATGTATTAKVAENSSPFFTFAANDPDLSLIHI